MSYSADFEKLIGTLRKNVRLAKAWALVLFIGGIGFTTFLFWHPADSFPQLMGLGPSVIGAALGIFQVKDLGVSHERIAVYLTLRNWHDRWEHLSKQERDMLLDLTRKALEEGLKR